MNKKTAAHSDLRKTRLWRNFFLLYSASLVALYIVLSMSNNAEQSPMYGATSQIGTHSKTVTSGADNSLIPEARLASYEIQKN
jgi:hypothetical protein